MSGLLASVFGFDPTQPGSEYAVLVLTETGLRLRRVRRVFSIGRWPRGLRKSQKATRRQQRFALNKLLRLKQAKALRDRKRRARMPVPDQVLGAYWSTVVLPARLR